ncbi:ribonuclease H-like domain-containing protein [Tanacetum coccineum]
MVAVAKGGGRVKPQSTMRRAVDGLTIVIRGRTTCDTVYQLAAAQDEPFVLLIISIRIPLFSALQAGSCLYVPCGRDLLVRNLLRELHTPLSTATIVYCDNVSAIYLFSNPVQHQRTKHIEIDIHFVRDLVTTGHIRVFHVLSRYQYADIFIKGLPTALFDEFRDNLSVRSSPAQTAGGC